MTTSRGKKRPREVSITQKFMEENFPREIGESRKYFVRTEPESSLTKKTGNEHIIYYQPFLNYDLVITRVPSGLQKFGNLFEIKIKPAAWAAAFNQRDLESTTKFVLKAIVHTECRRIIIADRIARHNTLKIIERAIIFMMSKFNPTSYINPWSFPSSFDKIMAKFPSLDDNLASNIRSVLKRFDPRVEQDAPSQTGELFDRMDSIVDNFWDDRDLPDELGDFLEHVAREETNYEEMFRKCVTVVRNSGNVRDMKMDTAQIAAALTKGTITQNTDQIVDAVQFSEERWKAAFKSGSISIAKIAAKLSSTIIRLQFGDTVELMESFIGVESLCAVQMLAIYRASKFLHNIMDMKQGYEEMYDSQIPSHNVYPTVEECIEIDKEIFLHGRNNVLGRLRDLLQEQVGISSAEKGIPSTSASVILPQAPTTPLVLPIVQNVENIDLGNLPSPLEVLGIMNLGVENITQNPGIIGVSRTDHDGANFSWVELPLNKEELKALKLNGGVNGIEPKLLRDEYQDPTYISLVIY